MKKERVITVTVRLKNRNLYDYDNRIEELEELVKAGGGEVIGVVDCQRIAPDKTTYIGKGKVEEVRDLAEKLEADTIIFNNELSGSQMRNLEKEIECKIVDRTNLILDIFASRAKTKEAVLQVELAQAQYRLPRLIGFRDYLSREGAGIGTRGPGEQKLELDRRAIMTTITNIKEQLKKIDKNREVKRKARLSSNIPIISMVGYTNAGKSTIANKLIEKYGKIEDNEEFMVKDMLFATLDTTLRKGKLPNGEEFLVSDTVGFVEDIPTKLIESFKSTLEEVKYADILLHVVDSSNINVEEQIKTTNDLLKEMEVLDKPIITIFNKMDKIDGGETVTIGKGTENRMCISAFNPQDIEDLLLRIEETLGLSYKEVTLLIPYELGEIANRIFNKYKDRDVEYAGNGLIIKTKLENVDLEKLKDYLYE